ncbi:MAG: thiamine diphosphokinase [Lachnospiraceae bacterium]|nr:thiamine diphosphokinase [Lachnospiraceae bacterium]
MAEENKLGKCIMIGAGDLTVSELKKGVGDLCIALDGGLGYCDFLRIEPDFIIGDFDSVTEEENRALLAIEESFPERVIRLKPEKDDTDMLYGLKYAMELGYKDFRLYGATGGRFDHTLANIQCLLYLKNNGCTGYLMDGNGMIMVLKNETVRFQANLEGTLSLFSLGSCARGVTIKGLKYELKDAEITNDFPVGISNEFLGKESEITVCDGEVVCMIHFES